MNEGKYIYGVTFHVNPKRRVHTFWFTDKKMADGFFNSVKSYPKTLDCSMMQIPVNETAVYDGVTEEGRIVTIRP